MLFESSCRLLKLSVGRHPLPVRSPLLLMTLLTMIPSTPLTPAPDVKILKMLRRVRRVKIAANLLVLSWPAWGDFDQIRVLSLKKNTNKHFLFARQLYHQVVLWEHLQKVSFPSTSKLPGLLMLLASILFFVFIF